MDFTPLYPLDSPSNLHVSPGSTFLLSVAESRTLLVRSAATLALVRSWTLPPSHPPIEHTAWSPDGAYFLAASLSAGRVDVFVLDPRRQPEEGAILSGEGEERERGEDVGAVAVIESGPMKMTGAAWAPAGGPPTILTFAGDELGMTAHCLADSSAAFFPDVKRSRYFPHPTDRTRFALLHRVNPNTSTPETVAIYHYVEQETSRPQGSYAALLAFNRSGASSSSSGPGLASNWSLESSFPARTNDAASLSWSPDGTLIAVWESSMEYKLNLFTPTGHSRGTLMISSDAKKESEGPIFFEPHGDGLDGESANLKASGTSSSGSLRSSSGPTTRGGSSRAKEEENGDEGVIIAGGGMGIRTVAWQPSGRGSHHATGLLAVGGYDEQVHLLTPFIDASPDAGDWGVLRPSLDLAKRNFSSTGHFKSSACSFREPTGWIEQTGGRGIVGFLQGSLPVAPPALKADWDKHNPKVGICWMEWDPSGKLLAVRNETLPSTIFIYSVVDDSASSLPTSAPQLLTVALFSASISTCTWRPMPTATGSANLSGSSVATLPQLALVTGTAAVYTWDLLSQHTSGPLMRLEGVPVPMSSGTSFTPTSVRYSPDGQKIVLASAGPPNEMGAHCVGVAVDEDVADQASMSSS